MSQMVKNDKNLPLLYSPFWSCDPITKYFFKVMTHFTHFPQKVINHLKDFI